MPELKRFAVFGESGRLGTLAAAARFLDSRSEKTIDLDGGGQISVQAEALTVQPDGSFYLRESPAPIGAGVKTLSTSGGVADPVDEGPPRAAAVTNPANGKKLEMFREGYAIERVLLDKIVAERPEQRQEGDTLILPVVEEVVVMEKRLMLREEIRITRRREQVERIQTIDSSV